MGNYERKLVDFMGNSGSFLPMRNEAAQAAGRSIRTIRELAGLTLAEAAVITGRSPGYLSQVETGKAPNVSGKYIANTVGALSAYIANPAQHAPPAPTGARPKEAILT